MEMKRDRRTLKKLQTERETPNQKNAVTERDRQQTFEGWRASNGGGDLMV